MSQAIYLIRRNVKLFFKDKGMFFSSFITPAILLVLYVTFLGKLYRESCRSALAALPGFIRVPDSVVDGFVSGQLVSSMLAVSCVTVAFCSNFLMVQDKVNRVEKDLRVSPVSPAVLSLSYYGAALLSTLMICFVAAFICLAYIGTQGWYLSGEDVALLMLDVFLLSLFGTALSSIVSFFLSTQGQISAVGTVISAGYGFICGAYMPIASFGTGVQRVISFFPGTYGTVLIRNHTMDGALREMKDCGVPAEFIKSLKDSVDCNLYFYENKVSISTMYVVLAASVMALVGIYVLMNKVKVDKRWKRRKSAAQS